MGLSRARSFSFLATISASARKSLSEVAGSPHLSSAADCTFNVAAAANGDVFFRAKKGFRMGRWCSGRSHVRMLPITATHTLDGLPNRNPISRTSFTHSCCPAVQSLWVERLQNCSSDTRRRLSGVSATNRPSKPSAFNGVCSKCVPGSPSKAGAITYCSLRQPLKMYCCGLNVIVGFGMTATTRCSHPIKASTPTFATVDGNTMKVNRMQPAKARLPIDLTPCGITIDLRLLHRKKACDPIDVTPGLSSTVSKLTQSVNAREQICTTVSGMEMDLSFSLPSQAWLSIRIGAPLKTAFPLTTRIVHTAPVSCFTQPKEAPDEAPGTQRAPLALVLETKTNQKGSPSQIGTGLRG
eukprot:m.309692 g.309692  ORF g.309692 m.309692 type:complete len:354 (+) comp16371_c1_seq16:1892-2953(+)